MALTPILLLILALAPLASIPPHVNPSALQPRISGVELWGLYVDALSRMAVGDYEGAMSLVNLTTAITPPRELSYLISRYRELLSRLSRDLDRLERLVEGAEEALRHNDLEEARRLIDEARVVAGRASIAVEDLREASRELASRLRVTATPIGLRLHERLMELLDRLQELIEELIGRVEEAEREASRLKPTSMTIAVEPEEVRVGGRFEVRGVLASQGEPLPGRVVVVYVAGAERCRVRTQANGTYSCVLRAPYLYVDSVEVTAIYTPRGDDLKLYTASKASTRLRLTYRVTEVWLKAPSIAYPGLPVKVEGEVLVDGAPSPGRRVQVYLAGVKVAEATTRADGGFTSNVTIPPTLPPSTYTLKAYVLPLGDCSPASTSTRVDVVRAPTRASVEAPLIVVLPCRLTIAGQYSTSMESSGVATVIVRVGGLKAVARASNFTFRSELYLPLLSSLTGLLRVEVVVEPDDPWCSPTRSELSILAVNPLGLSAIALVAVVAGHAARRARRGRPRPPPPQPVALAPAKPRPPPALPPGLRGEVVAAYRRALGVVERVVGQPMMPHHTLREYLAMASSRLDARRLDAFTRLTELAERALYAMREPSMAEVEEALRLCEVVAG